MQEAGGWIAADKHMTYLVRRIGVAVLVVLVTLTILGVMVPLVPGDPVRALLGTRSTPELAERVRLEMNLDASPLEQTAAFVAGAVRGDLGKDFISNTPVTSMLAAALPHSLVLAAAGLLVAFAVGIPLGIFSAARSGGRLDRFVSALTISTVSMQSFVIGLVLLLLFAVQFAWFPAQGAGSFDDPLDYAHRLVLPTMTLAIPWFGYLGRYVRANMLDVLSTKHVLAARAAGIPERKILGKYALRNVAVPIVALLGVSIGAQVTGVVFVELIFSRPGIGRLMLDGIEGRNFPIVRGAALVAVLLVVAGNLIADMTYSTVDPRIRLEKNKV